MDSPQTAGKVYQFLHCCRWIEIIIPDSNHHVEPLNEILGEAYPMGYASRKIFYPPRKEGRPTRRANKRISLQNLSCGAIHENVFHSLQNSFRTAVKLFYPGNGKVICVYTDTSDKFWSGVVTKSDPELLQLLNWSSFER